MQALQCSTAPEGQGAAAVNFGCMPLLSELSLAVERLTQLPAGVAGLSHLSVLDLSYNRLTDLPPGPYLGRLRALSLANNPMPRLPAALAAATALEALDVTACLPLEEAGLLAKASGEKGCGQHCSIGDASCLGLPASITLL